MMPSISADVLITGIDVEIDGFPVKMHQPSMKEIAYKGRGKFFQSINLFHTDKQPLVDFIKSSTRMTEEEKEYRLANIAAYDSFIFSLSVIELREEDNFLKDLATMFFQVIFPGYEFSFDLEEEEISLVPFDEEEETIVVSREHFQTIHKVAEQIFLLNKFYASSAPQSELSPAAQKIADKMAKSAKRVKELGGEGEGDGDASIEEYLSRIISILGVLHDLDYLTGLTVYQLQNQFERFSLQTGYLQSFQAALAGAKDIDMVDWYKKL